MSDFDEISSKHEWYVVHTYTGYEKRVKANIERLIVNRSLQEVITDIVIPFETVSGKDKDGNEKITEKIIYRGCVFIRMLMNDESWHIVRNITGVTGFIGLGARPTPLTDDEIARIGLITSAAKTIDFSVGETVTIKSDPFTGNTAVVSEISDDKTKIKVLVSLFGRELPLELNADDVEPLSL